MAELNARDTKLVQYLNEALTKEKQLEQALQAHIAMTTVATYRKRLQQHLTETKRHAREVERRVKKIGGKGSVVQEAASLVQDVAAKGAALAQGPVHMVRGTSEQEVLLKNARTEFKEEAEEIAHYTAIQKLAEAVGDKETARLAKAILREEKRMAGFLEKLIPRLTTSVVQAEIPRSERSSGRRRTTSRRSTSGTARASSSRSSSRTRSSGTRSATKRSSAAKRKTARSGSARKTTARSRTASRSKSTAARSGSARRTSSARRTTARRTTARRSS